MPTTLLIRYQIINYKTAWATTEWEMKSFRDFVEQVVLARMLLLLPTPIRINQPCFATTTTPSLPLRATHDNLDAHHDYSLTLLQPIPYAFNQLIFLDSLFSKT